MNHIKHIETILYVSNQQASTLFYTKLLRQEPILNVPGMTEFKLGENFKLGIMPNEGIAKILLETLPHPDLGVGIPRCELYFTVSHIYDEYNHAIQSGAKLISPIAERDWGDVVCYFSDLDGHIIAYAEKINKIT